MASSSGAKLSHWRVGFQIFLHAVLIGHVLGYYFLHVRAVGSLDFQDFFHSFLGHGVITFAVIFAVAVYLGSLVFGRIFCSWGCHFGATQDLAAWVLRRLGWTPPLVRTRFLHWCPFLVLSFVFLWPSFERWLARGWKLQPLESLDTLAGAGPWAQLPGWFFSIVTFAACGVGILLFLGTRGFCRFVCPYGAIFRVTDLVAPFRVRRVANCSTICAKDSVGTAPPCTQVCPTAIDVHAETERWGAVKSVDCVRCNLCVEACPSQALRYQSGQSLPPPLPSPASSQRGENSEESPSPDRGRRRGRQYSLTLTEEVLALLVTLFTFVVSDLVYGGHFLAATLALGEGFLTVFVLRTFRQKDLTAGRIPLRVRGSFRLAGISLVGGFFLSWIFLFQAAAFKTHRYRGMALRSAADAVRSSVAQGGVENGERRSLLSQSALSLRAALAYFPGRREIRQALISTYQALGDRRAVVQVGELLDRHPESLSALDTARLVLVQFGDKDGAALVEARLRTLRERRKDG